MGTLDNLAFFHFNLQFKVFFLKVIAYTIGCFTRKNANRPVHACLIPWLTHRQGGVYLVVAVTSVYTPPAPEKSCEERLFFHNVFPGWCVATPPGEHRVCSSGGHSFGAPCSPSVPISRPPQTPATLDGSRPFVSLPAVDSYIPCNSYIAEKF